MWVNAAKVVEWKRMKNLNLAAIKLARPLRDAWKVSCRRLDLFPSFY